MNAVVPVDGTSWSLNEYKSSYCRGGRRADHQKFLFVDLTVRIFYCKVLKQLLPIFPAYCKERVKSSVNRITISRFTAY
jgi:hypothetical protein